MDINVIIVCQAFKQAGVEHIANVAELRDSREVKGNMLRMRVVLQDFEVRGPCC